ncbi:hypothetical protein [Staphylococcus shinii]|uniref:hypothetical protein n=1 Tax=Staphylococcus shinii TaxID=2912228 RepID=UPI003F842FCF
MAEELQVELSERVTTALMINKLDYSFSSVEEVSNWMMDIDDLFGTQILDEDYQDLLSFGLGNINIEDGV